MELNDVLPSDEAASRLNQDVVVSNYGFAQVNEICELKRRSMLDIGLAIGYRIKVNNPEFDLEQYAAAYENVDPKLYEQFSVALGESALLDLSYSHAQLADEKADYRTVAELLIAIAYPNVLHIGDVEFSNPSLPVPEESRIRAFSHFKGLGLLPALVGNCVDFANEKGLDSICITPAADDLIPLFESVGFYTDANPLADIMRNAGMPGPMSLDI